MFCKNLIHSIKNPTLLDFVGFGVTFLISFFASIAFYFAGAVEENLLLKEVIMSSDIEYIVKQGGRRGADWLQFHANGIDYSVSCGVNNMDINAPCNKKLYDKTLTGKDVKIFEISADSKQNIEGVLISGQFKEKDKDKIYFFTENNDFFEKELKKGQVKVYIHKSFFFISLICALFSFPCFITSARNLAISSNKI